MNHLHLLQIRLLLIGTIASTLAADVRSKREKRSFWPSFLGGGGSAVEVEADDIENETVPEAVANVGANPLRQPLVFPQDIRLPGQLQTQPGGVPYGIQAPAPILHQGNLHYPIYRVHKYNGVHLNPIPVSLVAQHVSNPHVEVPGQAAAEVPVIESDTEVDEDEADEEQQPVEDNLVESEDENEDETEKEVETVEEPKKKGKKPTGEKKPQLKITPDLIQLAKKLGIKDVRKLPDLSEAMNLLGTTTQEETIQTIKELAETEDGLMLIKQYINTDGSDQDNAASEPIESYALPRDDGEPIAQPSDAVAVNAFNPLRYFDATLDRTRNSLNILTPFVPTPAPTLLGRIGQFANIFNPFAGSEEIPIPPIGEADAEELVDTEDDDGDSQPTGVSPTGTIPIPELPHLPQLPISEIDAHSIDVPRLPQLHIPHSYILPQAYAAKAVPGGGPYIRVKLPLNGFNPTPEIPIHPKYLQHYQHQLALQRNRAQVVQQSHHFVPGVTVAVHTPHTSIQVGPLSKTPEKVEAIQPVPLNHLVPPAHTTPHVNHPVTHPIPAPHHSSPSSHPIPLSHPALTAHPAPPVQHPAAVFSSSPPIIHSAPLSPRPAPASPHLAAPATHLLPPVHAARPLRPQTVAPAAVQTASHVGHLPLSDNNYEIFKNAPRIVTSYGTPTLPYTFPEDRPGASFSSSSAFDLRPASSDVHERSVLPGSALIAKEAPQPKSVDTTVRKQAPPAVAVDASAPANDIGPSAPANSIAKPAPVDGSNDSTRTALATAENTDKISDVPITAVAAEQAPVSGDASRTVIAGSDNAPMVLLSEHTENHAMPATASQVLDAARASMAALDSLDSLAAKSDAGKQQASEPAAALAETQTLNDQTFSAPTSGDAAPELRATEAKKSVDSPAAPALPETAAASTVSRRQAMLQRRSSTYVAYDEFGNRLNRSKPQRAAGYESYATGKLHTADPEVVKMLPLTMRQAIKANRQ